MPIQASAILVRRTRIAEGNDDSAPAGDRGGTVRTAPPRKPPLSSRMMRATWRNLPPKRYDVGWEPGLAVPAADGSPLLTDHYFPRAEGDFPTLLVRSPYGRGLPWSPMNGILFAEQGFHVVLQSCRGTGGSGGRFHLWRNEAADGQATVSWLREQPWFNGTLGTIGPSYLGYVQWALALDPPPELKAMVIQVGLHDPHALFHAGGALRLENALTFGVGMTYQHQGRGPAEGDAAPSAPPAQDQHRAAAARGAHLRPWRSPLAGGRDDPPGRRRPVLGRRLAGRAGGAVACAHRLWSPDGTTHWPTRPSNSTPGCVRPDARPPCSSAPGRTPPRCNRAGPRCSPRASPGCVRTCAPTRPACAPPRCACTSAAKTPGGTSTTGRRPRHDPLVPHPGRDLTRQAPADSAPLASFRYDPADPTPSVGGPLLSRGAGSRDNRSLEAREDVLTFTGPAADRARGRPRPGLRAAADLHGHRLRRRLRPPVRCGRTGPLHQRLRRAGPAADRRTGARAGHRADELHRAPLRRRSPHPLQISGGAHPRFARTPAPGSRRSTPPPSAGRITLHADSALMLPRSGRTHSHDTPASDSPPREWRSDTEE